MKRVLKVALFLLGIFGSVIAKCPSKFLTRPCSCENNKGDNTLICENITKTDLQGVFRRTHGISFNSLFLVRVSFDSISSSDLLDKQIRRIGIANSNLKTLFDKTPSPSSILSYIKLINVHFPGPFQWNQLKPLTKLDLFHAVGVKIPVLNNSFKNNVSKNLTQFYLSNTCTVQIAQGVLSEFKNLQHVKINKNPLKTYTRDYFSRPSKILYLDLSENEIESLPADAFVDMPKLRGLSLAGNEISIISDGVFSQIDHPLVYLKLHDNPLNCDCGFNWIISNKPKLLLTGNCASPKKLKGKLVADLQQDDIAPCD